MRSRLNSILSRKERREKRNSTSTSIYIPFSSSFFSLVVLSSLLNQTGRQAPLPRGRRLRPGEINGGTNRNRDRERERERNSTSKRLCPLKKEEKLILVPPPPPRLGKHNLLQTLRSSREMTVNEIRLTLAIESPLVREQRELLGVERGAGGVSRDDVAAALAAVAAGRVPRDRLALKELHREMSEWPFLKDAGGGGASTSGKAGEGGMSGSSLARRARYGGAAAGAGGGGSSSSSSGWRRGQARPRMLGRDPSEEPQTLADRLPEWMGYGALYAISAIPVLIAGSVIAILFFNSLK